LLKNKYEQTKKTLLSTILLGVVFSFLQGFEYTEAPFTIADSSFGTTFFIATGFHGLHVIIGSIFLMVTNQRLQKIINTKIHAVGFECAA